ncbi:hypothetical protein ScPMuIL_009176 [Solemya velum]
MPPLIVVPDISKAVSNEGQLHIDFLLPNGILLPLVVDFYKPLELLKDVIWREAEKNPLYDKMKRSDHYMFVCINQLGQKEDIWDECQCLSDIRPLGAFLLLKEKKDNDNVRKKQMDEKINKLMGRGMHDIDAVHTTEIADFRKRMHDFCDNIINQRQGQGWLEKFMYKHPPRIRNLAELPSSVQEKLTDSNIMLSITIDSYQRVCKLQAPLDYTPDHLIDLVIQKQSKCGNDLGNTEQYILKVVGIEDYLYGEYPLQQFKYIYMCLLRKNLDDPKLKLLLRNDIMEAPPPVPPRPVTRKNPIPPQPSTHLDNIWNMEDKFYFSIKKMERINVIADNIKVKLVVGVFHGCEAICKKSTQEMPISDDGNCFFNTDLTFDLSVKDIPHMSKLCFTLCSRRRGTRELSPISWVNIPVFDFRSRLIFGERDLPMWPMADNVQLEDECYPIGTVSPNPLWKTACSINVTFPEYRRRMPVIYPSWEKIAECAAQNMEEVGQPGSPQWHPSKSHIEQMRQFIEQESMLGMLCEQDKEMMWMMRYECRERFPQSLPKLLSSVTWANHIDVAKMQVLLETWPKLPVEQSLELLDFNFPDTNVKKYAVSCLEDLKDDDLSQYLLQLVQALKYDCHLLSPLVEFLLRRALNNRHIGHQFFWLLRSEIHSPVVSVRFGLILEVYLKSHQDHLNLLVKQSEALNKLDAVNMLVKQDTDRGDMVSWKNAMQAVLNQTSYKEVLSDLYSPLTPLFKLQKLETEKCKCMASKKRPLWLVWSNADLDGTPVNIIYKSGDDLRQDMLTLQILQLMDSIWKSEGLDLRINAYGCIATGHERGVIEVVTESDTIANIQQEMKAGAFDKTAIYRWLKKKNPSEQSLNNAVEEFTLSCAGYTVATYVLGIGDRHNDNIMIKCTGQIFHIDFGHFLGRFKSKFGFRRERVPFVLTKHFMYVITKADTEPKNADVFQKYCQNAYLILRQHGTLLIRLFMMMLTSGIPQLTSVSDVDYLKEMLALQFSEDEARRKFADTCKKALNSLSPTLNWFIHNTARK